jgi:hypothetical protein
VKRAEPFTENDRGNGPATFNSPANQANHKGQPIEFNTPARAAHGPPIPFDPVEENDAAAAEIEAMFKWKLIGLRRMPAHQRAHALRAAREWRLQALLALRKKRARDQQARYVHWRQQLPPTGPPG